MIYVFTICTYLHLYIYIYFQYIYILYIYLFIYVYYLAPEFQLQNDERPLFQGPFIFTQTHTKMSYSWPTNWVGSSIRDLAAIRFSCLLDISINGWLVILAGVFSHCLHVPK